MQGTAQISVSDFEQGIGFYTAMFGKEPAVRTQDFASWQSEDALASFAIVPRKVPTNP